MELLKSGFIKDFKLNLKVAEEEQKNIFKYLKKYYNNDAYYFIIKKDEKESITIHKLEKFTSVLFNSLDILYYRWHRVEELQPAEAKGYHQTQREEVNNYDLKNDWDFTYSKTIILISKLYNNHNKNSFEPGYIQKLYNDKKTRLQQQAQNIRAEKARAEREKKRQEAEATTAQFKKNFLVKLNNGIKTMFEIESIKPDDRMELLKKMITFKNKFIDKNIIDLKVQKLLYVCDLFKKYKTTVRTVAKQGNRVYITTFEAPLLDYFMSGCYSLMLENFEACNGCDWYSNTEKFEILETEVPADTETIRHNYF